MNFFCNYFHDRIHDTYTYGKSYKLLILIFNRYQSIYWHIDDPLSILFFPNNVNFSSNSEETATTCTERSIRSSHLPPYHPTRSPWFTTLSRISLIASTLSGTVDNLSPSCNFSPKNLTARFAYGVSPLSANKFLASFYIFHWSRGACNICAHVLSTNRDVNLSASVSVNIKNRMSMRTQCVLCPCSNDRLQGFKDPNYA